MTEGTFRAGVGRVDITPPLTAPHANWGAQTHVVADGVETPLWATALVVDDGATLAAWIDLDVMIITREQTVAIRAAVAKAIGTQPDKVRVSVTHSHAGPPPNGWSWAKDGQAAIDGYYALMPEYAAGAALAAFNTLQPARIGVGSGESRVAVNRREISPEGRPVTGVNFDGIIDPEVFVARIDAIDGSPIAAVVGYTMHPTTLGPRNRLVSADWPGYLKRTVEQLTGATCLFAQGATGNIGPGPEGFTDRVEVIKKLGTMVGCEAVRTYLELSVPAVSYHHERVWESGAPLAVWTAERQPDVPVRVRVESHPVALTIRELPTLEEAQAAVDEIQSKLDALKAADAPKAEIEAATFVAKRSYMRLARVQAYGGKTSSEVELQLFQVGPMVIVGTEGEPFVEIGLDIKSRSPFPGTWFCGYTSGWAGYIPTADAYPIGGYEVDITPFDPVAATEMIEAAVALLENAART
ncbi:MAG: neutral/alkaline non-lysosomal ceramidase N-terminal domain-containing protein [Thermomicrobiales bacterium]|nr:neutral/alkaline non-lysosomal ceramidase N-terminal domain-containing protein [Thermomicrobiales bacterium]